MTPATPPPSAPSRVRFGVLAFACSLSMLTYLDRVCISRVKEDIQTDLMLTNFQIGMIFSAFLAGYMLFEVPGGWMGDRWGARRVLTRIVLWWSVFTALTGSVVAFSWNLGEWLGIGNFVFFLSDRHFAIPVIGGFFTLLLVRFLFGCGEAGAYPNLARVTGNWFPYQERAVVQGSIWMSARLGGAIAPFVIGRLTFAFGWRRAFWILGSVGLVWVVGFARWFRDRPEDKPSCNDAERDLIRSGPYSFSAHEAAAVHAPVPWGRLLRSSSMWALCLASCCVSFGWYFYPTWLPEFLKNIHGFEYKDSEILSGLPFLCGAAGCILGGRLSDRLVRATGSRRWGRSLFGVFGFTGAGLCVLATGFVREPWQAMTLLCLAFFVNDLAIPIIWAVSADIGGRYAGTVAGTMNMAGGVGGFTIPVLIPVLLTSLAGTLVERWRGIFIVMATAWFIGALAWLFIDASTPLIPEEEAEGADSRGA